MLLTLWYTGPWLRRDIVTNAFSGLASGFILVPGAHLFFDHYPITPRTLLFQSVVLLLPTYFIVAAGFLLTTAQMRELSTILGKPIEGLPKQ